MRELFQNYYFEVENEQSYVFNDSIVVSVEAPDEKTARTILEGKILRPDFADTYEPTNVSIYDLDQLSNTYYIKRTLKDTHGVEDLITFELSESDKFRLRQQILEEAGQQRLPL